MDPAVRTIQLEGDPYQIGLSHGRLLSQSHLTKTTMAMASSTPTTSTLSPAIFTAFNISGLIYLLRLIGWDKGVSPAQQGLL